MPKHGNPNPWALFFSTYSQEPDHPFFQDTMPSTERLRNVCFTLNNYGDEGEEQIQALALHAKVSYIVYGREVGALGTPHLQGYAEFKDKIAFNVVRKMLLNAHLEQRGSDDPKCAAGYCKKGTSSEPPYEQYFPRTMENPESWDGFEAGTISNPGKRSDLARVAEEVYSGKRTVDEVTVEDPNMHHFYGRTLAKIEDIALRKRFRTEMPTSTWAWGPTGVGKSHWLYHDFDPATHYIWKNSDNGWQDGYIGQKIVLINEFRGGIPYAELLQLLDKWPYFVPRRGKEPAPMLATEFRITSSMSPSKVYHNVDEKDSINQLLRRLKVVEVTSKMGAELLLYK